MRHLFIINTAASGIKGNKNVLIQEIMRYFNAHSHIPFDIHETHWVRDAWIYTRNYVTSTTERVRVHCYGGSGTFFDVINAVAGLAHCEVALYPFGGSNEFLHYFGAQHLPTFESIDMQVKSGTIPIDLLRTGTRYSLSYINAGYEAQVIADGNALHNKFPYIPLMWCFMLSGANNIFRRKYKPLPLKIELDGKRLDSHYTSLYLANTSHYSAELFPAKEAHPNDGRMEIYLTTDMPRRKMTRTMLSYLRGNHLKTENRIHHRQGTNIKITSPEVMCFSYDGEVIYSKEMEIAVAPNALQFVCPNAARPGGTK